ncbi:hypothetical protein ACFFIX_14270 [Metabacillus herbersteinensis]|uniref:Uncharacterized protein n=1 Tax=Metabacillus herbersteinensis TaxID=283816 RepID=A0ABV6GFY1_9BACI
MIKKLEVLKSLETMKVVAVIRGKNAEEGVFGQLDAFHEIIKEELS